jgi:hypothetical protein
MRVINKPVEMIAWHTKEGVPSPVRFRFEGRTISVDRIIEKGSEKAGGKLYLTYTCESIIEDVQKRYILRMEQESLKWFLYKI